MSRSMQRNVRNLLVAQLLLTLAVAAAFFFINDGWHALSAAYGGSLVMLNTVLMFFRFRKAEQLDGMSFQMAMYGGMFQRMIIAVAGIAIGIKVLKLMPVPQIAAFGIAYISFALVAGNQKP